MKLVQEFKEFALKGNMVDLAVGVIIGAVFGGVVKSIVDDVLMPPLGWLLGGLDFKDKHILLAAKDSIHPITHKAMPADVVLSYGKFINASITFLITAAAIFMVVKALNSMKRKEAAVSESAPPPPPADVQLLTEIRDLLKQRPA